MDIDMQGLEHDGYIVIPNFLNSEMLQKAITDYEKLEYSSNLNYQIKPTSSMLFEPLMQPILDQVSSNTNISVDIIAKVAAYFDTKVINFKWHQDHESYYQWQDAYNALNFWIPITKPDPTTTGMSLIPQSALLEKIPDIFEKRIKGRGAKKFFPQPGGRTIMEDDVIGDKLMLDLNLDELAVSPKLNAGDLLLLRHDVIHKTQDCLTNRVAISLRAFCTKTVIKKENLLQTCIAKKNVVKNNPEIYNKILQNFEQSNTSKFTLIELWNRLNLQNNS